MPGVLLELEIQAPADRVWEAVVDVERYPESMENVRWAKILEYEHADARKTAWSVLLKGSILEWRDRETLDHVARVMSFEQLSGDMEVFTGSWELTELGPERTAVKLEMRFEIGIPLLADMLNPVAERALRGNARDMLLGVEREALGAV
jgi:ribosome-associated toxin RatA of RatAB toxin-antitoxin module